MNDPGLDEGIENAARALSHNQPDQVDDEKERYETLLEPSRWYISATEIPLLASCFGPVANAFSICALCQYWRVEYDPNIGQYEGSGTSIKDPNWLLAINGIQVLFGLVANLALCLNMARRLRFAIAQPITVGGYFVSGTLLTGLLASADRYLQLPGPLSHAWSQAYYYAIMAAFLYLGMSIMMTLTVYGAVRGYYKTEFQLSASQRTLIAQTVAYMGYIMLGGLAFAHIEGWSFLDSLYWASFTALTIGLGSDFSPKTRGGRTLLFFFSAGAILTIGLVIGSIRSLMLERAKEKISIRLTEKERERIVKRLDSEEGKKIVEPIKSPDASAPQSREEYSRRRKEFMLMRFIQNRSAQRRKWWGLIFSILAFSCLWFLGAMVFWFGERDIQAEASYFEMLYFSYTSLLTIGYGDVYPQANSSKPFFVLWTIIAVPTLTILISTLGDTLIKVFRDLINLAASYTVLPGGNEKSLKAQAERTARSLRDGHLFSDDDVEEMEADPIAAVSHGFRPGKPRSDEKSRWHKEALDEAERLTGETLDRETKEQDQEAGARDLGARIIRHKDFLLAVSIREVLGHTGDVPAKKYSYAEWAFFMSLLGVDERNSDQHREVHVHMPERMEKDGGHVRQQKEFSWIGVDSPLLHDDTESDWLLNKLTKEMEQGIIKKISAKNKRRKAEDAESGESHKIAVERSSPPSTSNS